MRRAGIFLALAVSAGLACSNQEEPAFSVSVDDEKAVLGAIACGRGGPVIATASAPPSEWSDVGKLRTALGSLMKATDDRPALAQDTLTAFAGRARASELALFPGDLHCPNVSLLTWKEYSRRGTGAMAFSRVAFNRRGTQALVLVTSASGSMMGSSDTFLFLTRPAGTWVVVGRVPWAVA